MKTLQLLIVNTDAANTRALTEMVDQSRFAVMTADTEETAVEKNCQVNFDVVIAGNTLSDESVRKLKAVLKASSPDTLMMVQKGKPLDEVRQQLNEWYLTRQRERLQHIAVKDTTDAKNLGNEISVIE